MYVPVFKPNPGYSKWFESQYRPQWQLPCFKDYKVLCIGDSHLKIFGKYNEQRKDTCIVSYSGADLGPFIFIC